MSALADPFPLDESDAPEPLFVVEPPDGRRYLAEVTRQTTFLGLMRLLGPSVEVRALPNAGKRNPRQAQREGIKAGLFDLGCWWNRGHALIEFKGYDKGGRAGKLSANQIAFGNRLHRQGWPVGCFFTPEVAVEWLRGLGAPIHAR